MQWQLQEAKQRFSELVQRALDEGPQTVTRHGKEAVVVISTEEYRRLTGTKMSFEDFLLTFPDLDELEFPPRTDMGREVEL